MSTENNIDLGVILADLSKLIQIIRSLYNYIQSSLYKISWRKKASVLRNTQSELRLKYILKNKSLLLSTKLSIK